VSDFSFSPAKMDEKYGKIWKIGYLIEFKKSLGHYYIKSKGVL
jgi:hypothetical protein